MSKHIVNSLLEFAEEMESIGHECEFLEEAATEIMRLRVQVSALEAERDRLASRLKECRAKHMDDLLALSATAKAERELRAELAECIAALEKIANPISAMKRALPVGATLNGAMATTLSNDPNYLKEIAKAALAARKGEGEIGLPAEP